MCPLFAEFCSRPPWARLAGALERTHRRQARRDSASLRGTPDGERHRFAQLNPVHRIAPRRRRGEG
ncbi:hypothetical protein CBM2604_U10023 [Cupriavidus taiwanensis]|nr:hypothetical protein CBM2604_U10023 [Cupriavidus taiwanensis]